MTPSHTARRLLTGLRQAIQHSSRMDTETHAGLCELVEALAPWVERNDPSYIADLFGLDLLVQRKSGAILRSARGDYP